MSELDQILLPGHLRIPPQPNSRRLLLPRNKSSPTSRAHSNGKPYHNRHRPRTTPPLPRRNALHLRPSQYPSRSTPPTFNPLHSAAHHRRERSKQLDPFHRQNNVLPVPVRKRNTCGFPSCQGPCIDRIRRLRQPHCEDHRHCVLMAWCSPEGATSTCRYTDVRSED